MPRIVYATLAMIVYSALAMLAARLLGIDFSAAPGTVGYFQKLNWLLFPVYWPVMALFLHFSWAAYVTAWRSLYRHKTLYQNGAPVSDPSALDPFLDRLSRWRRWAVALSLPLSGLISWIDADCLLHEYAILAPRHCSAADFSIAFRLHDAFPQAAPQPMLLAFVAAIYLMQTILIATALTVLFQLLIHTIGFLRFERLAITRRTALEIRLNPRDPLGEFGLADFNRAINLTYVFVAVAMLIPVLSVAFKPDFDAGRVLMELLLPVILIAPSVIPIADRIRRRQAVEDAVLEANDDAVFARYREQKSWPFDETAFAWVGKLALSIIVLEWGYVITKNLTKLIAPGSG